MKLLIITQSIDINNPILGFFGRWVQEFAKHCEKITVICLEEGEHKFYSVNKSKNAVPRNENSGEFSGTGVKVLSLGKEYTGKGRSLRRSEATGKGATLKEYTLSREKRCGRGWPWIRIKYIFNFYKYIYRERKNYDTVFVHMNPIYVILGGLFWKIFNKKISLWYTHKSVDIKLRLAEKLANIIFSASKGSFQLQSTKVFFIDHGIAIDEFFCAEKKQTNNTIYIISIGRITRIKNCDTLIKAANIFSKKWDKNFKIKFIGDVVTKDDKIYYNELRDMTQKYNLKEYVDFIGSVDNSTIKSFYCDADMTVNMSPSGGLDKVVMESMATGTPVLTSNKEFEKYFGDYASRLIFRKKDEKELAEKIIKLSCDKDIENISIFLKKQAKKYFDITVLVNNITKYLS